MKNKMDEAFTRVIVWRSLRNTVSVPRPPAPGTKAITVLLGVKQKMGK